VTAAETEEDSKADSSARERSEPDRDAALWVAVGDCARRVIESSRVGMTPCVTGAFREESFDVRTTDGAATRSSAGCE
jgi:hypothetical protein